MIVSTQFRIKQPNGKLPYFFAEERKQDGTWDLVTEQCFTSLFEAKEFLNEYVNPPQAIYYDYP